MPENFKQFRAAHPRYDALLNSLAHDKSADRGGRLLLTAAQLLHRIHGDAMGPVADEILSFVDHHYPAGYVDRYIGRVRRLAALQRAFELDPSPLTLGDPQAHVDAEDYGLALLLSIVLTNHRFEIMTRLAGFARSLAQLPRPGRLAAVGVGTGYELAVCARMLPNWRLEGYEIDGAMRNFARELWSSLGVDGVNTVDARFPLETPDPDCVRRYDAIIMCELCEHLRDPLTALRCVGDYLNDEGRAFVTMAINIAQEDHIFLYPTVESCRVQIRAAGLEIISEWLAPQAVLNVPSGREQDFKKGNYIAVVRSGAP